MARWARVKVESAVGRAQSGGMYAISLMGAKQSSETLDIDEPKGI